MKTLFVIVASVLLAIWFVINFIWSKALGEREDKLKKDREGFLKGISSLNKQKAELDKRLNDINTEYSIIGQERERLAKREGELNEKAKLLDTRAAELKDYADMLDEVQASLADREQKNRDDEPVDVSAAMKELDEKIELVKQRGSLKDADKYLDEMRGREPEKPVKKAKKGGKK